ncbi:M48 family metalloprotease [Maribacter sp. 2307UL18-2]|uniref:M48 family metalloprotease n=1 Tax=Maribacter sp. 2307UL18-2 TaxID=3386274 RepID=UPI0039BCF593
MKTITNTLISCLIAFLLGSLALIAQEEVWKEATIVKFAPPFDEITINLDDEEFVFPITQQTKFVLGKKKSISKNKIFVGSTVDASIVIENRKRILTKIQVGDEEYGKVKRFVGVFESFSGDSAFIDGRKVMLTNDTTIKCEGGNDCACSKGRSFLGFDELELGSFLTVYGEQDEKGVFQAEKIEVCKNTYGKADQEFLSDLTKNFDASKLNEITSIPKGVFKSANGLHNGAIKLGNIEFKLLDDIKAQGYINMIGNRLLPEYTRNEDFSKEHEVYFRFYVIENDVPNAMALANGMIFINTGLLKIAENEAQIAAVLGHEIAHVTYEHGIKKYKTTRFTNSNIGKKTSKWLKKAFQKKSGLEEGTLVGDALGTALEHTTPENIMSLFNKKNETQSDRAGLYYAYEAGYDPREAARFWEVMMANTGDQKFMNSIFKTTANMVNNIESDLDDVDYASLGEDVVDVLVGSLLETVYTSHPLVVKRVGNINQLLTSIYADTDFSELEVGKKAFDTYLGKLKN